MADNLHRGHRKRMKAQFLQSGAEHFESHQLLEMLLFYGIPQKDTNPLAHKLLNEFGSLSGVLNADFEDLCRIDGISEHTATLLMLCGQLVPRCYQEKQNRRPLDTEKALAEYLQPHFIKQKKEKVVLLSLNNRKEPLACTIVSKGSITAAEAGAREIVEIALRTKATAVVLAHNHPAGHPIPSAEDLAVTKQLVRALQLVDVLLVDHLIFVEDEYLSLHQQPRYAPIFSNFMYQIDL
ncbi:MAG: DNA repair protein RadC [Clostridia bacterium]|nr:DNA repair protein RadC [Clostridia bacterium]